MKQIQTPTGKFVGCTKTRPSGAHRGYLAGVPADILVVLRSTRDQGRRVMLRVPVPPPVWVRSFRYTVTCC